MGRTLRRSALGITGLLTLFALWWLGVALFGTADGLSARFSPQATLLSLGELLERCEFYEHALVSLRRVLLSLFLTLLVEVPLGLLVDASRNLEATTTPAFQFLRMISPLSWMPIAVMLVGMDDQPIYFLLTFATLWPILLNTVAGVRQLSPCWLQLSRSLTAAPWETLHRVILPGILGHMLTDVHLAIGILQVVLIPCEMLDVGAGLGYYILDTHDRLAYSELMAMMLLIGLLGYLLDTAARGLYRRRAHGALGQDEVPVRWRIAPGRYSPYR